MTGSGWEAENCEKNAVIATSTKTQDYPISLINFIKQNKYS